MTNLTLPRWIHSFFAQASSFCGPLQNAADFAAGHMHSPWHRHLLACAPHFPQEWLSSSNMLRQIYDLSNLEKEEGQTSGGTITPPPKERTTLNL